MAFHIIRTAEDDAAGPSLDISTAIAEFYQDFPEHKKDVFILNPQAASTGARALKPYLSRLSQMEKESPAMKGGVRLAKSMALDAFAEKRPHSIRISEEAFADQGAIDPDAVRGRIIVPAGNDYSARVLKSLMTGNELASNKSFPVMADEFNNTEIWQQYALDHEIGHAVTGLRRDMADAKTVSIGNRAECAADAYAMIRHFQRYGTDSKFPHLVRDLRNINLAHRGDIAHWTSRAIDVVIALNAKGQIAQLTPQQSRDLALAIAKKVQLSADAEYNLAAELVIVKDVTERARAEKMGDGNKAMAYVQAVCLAGALTRSAAVLEVCKRYMTHYAKYIPKDAPVTIDKPKLEEMARNLKVLREQALSGEPSMPALLRDFRNAHIDARIKKKPQGPDTPKPPAF